MGQDNTIKIMEVFYENPDKQFTIREISKLAKVPRATVHKILMELKRERIINKMNMAENSLVFKTKKINFFAEKIVSSWLIEELIEKLNPSCIILFGSIRKGDSNKESDVDLFVESSVKKEFNLKEYEKKIGHKVQLFIEPNINKLHDNLFNNVVNGIKLYGSFKIK